MKEKIMRLMGGMVMVLILLTGYQPVAAAPSGEIKTTAPRYGNEVPIPWLELSHANDWLQLLYDHLVGSTPEGKLSSENGLATKWEMTPDGLTWTFYLRKGAKFHNGVEVTAKDVKFSIEQNMQPDSISSYASNIREAVERIEVKDPYTVVIQCKIPSIFLANWLSDMESPDGMIIPKDYYERVGKDEFQKHPIGSGPYKFHSQVVGSYIKLEATDKHWWAGVPRYKYMTYLVIPEESTRFAMLKTGEADITHISRDRVKEMHDGDLKLVTKPDHAIVVLHPNMQWTSPVFSDIRFRKALNLAIDKASIIKHIFAGMAKPVATYPGKNIFACGGDPTLKPYPYNPEEARRLIKEGGYGGHEFTLISYPRSGCPEFPRVVEAVAGYWQKIGLKPTIKMSMYSTWRKKWRSRKTQNTIHGYDDTTNPECASLLGKFRQKWFSKDKRSTVSILELDERFEKMGNSVDLAEVSKLMGEIYRYAYDNYLMIPIAGIPDTIATTKKVPTWNPGSRRRDSNYRGLIRER